MYTVWSYANTYGTTAQIGVFVSSVYVLVRCGFSERPGSLKKKHSVKVCA